MRVIHKLKQWLIAGFIVNMSLVGPLFADDTYQDIKEKKSIIKFDDDLIEIKVVSGQGSTIELVKSDLLGTLPLEVITEDNQGFVKVQVDNSVKENLKYESNVEIWLSKSYLIFKTEERPMRPICLQANIGQRTDRRQLHAHGVGGQGCISKNQ